MIKINRIILFMLIGAVLSESGCIRLTGGAGYTKYQADKEPETKSVGFDTNNIVNPNQAKGSIQMGENQ